MIVKCSCCGKQFDKQPCEMKKSKSGKHFCSRSCSAKVVGVGLPRNPPVDRVCKACGKTYHTAYGHRSRSFCKECGLNGQDWYKNKTLREYQERDSVKVLHVSSRNAHIRNFARSWNKHLKEHPCQNCGYSKHIEFCHIKAVSSFNSDTLLGEVNSSENIVILCRNCHWELDHGDLTLEQIPKRK